MRIASRLALSAIALSINLLAAAQAHAVSLTAPTIIQPFADTSLPGTTAALRPELAGTVEADDLQAFSFEGVTGTVQNRVVRETASGTLDFYWKIDVDPASTGRGLSAFRLTDFGFANLVDADIRTDGLGSANVPDTARLFNPASNPTGSINFLFSDGLLPGDSSRFFFLHTTATSFTKTARFDMLTFGDQKLSPIYSTFAPAVPEPSTYALFGVGLAIAGVVARRRRG